MDPGIRELRIESLGDLIEAVTPRCPDPDSGRLRDRVVFRGVSHPEPILLTSLDRLGTPDQPPHSKGHLEVHLLRNFIRYSRPYVQAEPLNDWEYLVLAQHHGLPTRLLDWSYSPLTAAHFATWPAEADRDRVIWKLEWGRMHDRFGLPPLALMVEDLDRVLARKGIGSIWELVTGESVPEEPFASMLEPPALDGRIVAQAAAFTLCSDRNRSLNEFLCDAGLSDCLTRFVIPAERVQQIRDQLDLCSIDERRLFPDLDGLAAQMRRYYAASSIQAGRCDEQEELRGYGPSDTARAA